MGTAIELTDADKKNIDRLIDTGSPDNISLAYNLMIGLGCVDIDALKRIIYKCKTSHGLAIIPLKDWLSIWVDYLPRHDGHFGLTIDGADEDLCFSGKDFTTLLTKTRHIWESLI